MFATPIIHSEDGPNTQISIGSRANIVECDVLCKYASAKTYFRRGEVVFMIRIMPLMSVRELRTDLVLTLSPIEGHWQKSPDGVSEHRDSQA
jgi:hypothetical protein